MSGEVSIIFAILNWISGVWSWFSNIVSDVRIFLKKRAGERVDYDKKIYSKFSIIISDIYIEGIIKGTEESYSNELVRRKQQIKDFVDDTAERNKFLDLKLQSKFNHMVADLLNFADQLEKQNTNRVEMLTFRTRLEKSYKSYRSLIKDKLII